MRNIRSLIRMLILESTGTTGYKMIFLAGLPGGGKSTLLSQLGIEDQFTNCNIDNFFEPSLMPELGTKNLHNLKNNFFKWHYLRKEKLAQGQELTPEEIFEYEDASRLNRREGELFRQAIAQFKDQIGEVCGVGANFIIDGTSINPKRTAEDKTKYESMGYDCCMIFVDIDTTTSVERNIQRGESGGRSIHSSIIEEMGPKMEANKGAYAELFGDDFFLVSNRGTFEDYQTAIEGIRPGVEAFMAR